MEGPGKRSRWLLLCGVVLMTIGAGTQDRLYAAGQEKTAHAPYPFEIYYSLVNTEFTLLHELGHALIAELKIPVLGREEDAADQIATILLVASHEGVPGDLVEKLNLVGIELRIEAVEETIAYWDSHPPPIQRFYNLLCLAYGMDPEPFVAYLKGNWLPWERGWYCDREYRQVLTAMRWIYRHYGQKEGAQLPVLSDPEEFHFHPPLAATAQTATRGARSSKITVSYDFRPTQNGDFLLYPLKVSRLAERVAERVAQTFDLPRDLTIVFTNCNDDAYWNERSRQIVFCYDLLDLYYRHAKTARQMGNMAPENFTAMEVVVPAKLLDQLKQRAAKEGRDLNAVTTDALQRYLESPPGKGQRN